jgi:DNA-binding transcriptional MerR regulator
MRTLERKTSQSFAPHEAAILTGVSVHSIRRWCEYHAAYLSPRANPESGVQRRLTPRDVEVMKHVKSLRDDGLSVNLINEQLAGLTFAEIDSDPSTDSRAIALPTAQEAPQSTPGALVTVDTIVDIQRQIATLQQSVNEVKQAPRRLEWFSGFGFGFVAALLFVLVILGLAVLYGGLR